MPVAEHIEVERKYDADLSVTAPSWADFDGSPAVGSILRAVYFDTEDLRLLAQKITLRWRSGEAAEGWHLKLPAHAGRVELQARGEACDPDLPPDPARLPQELAARLRAWTAGRPLVPVARLVTLREEVAIPEAGLFCDDLVTATRLIGSGQDGGPSVVWREWELELFDDPNPQRVHQAQEHILRAARPSRSTSKVAKALGRGGAVPAVPKRAPQTAGAFLAFRLAAARNRMCALDFPVQTDQPDSVHQLRVSTRALRSLLQAFGPVLRAAPTKQLADELRWLASELGSARDAEVRAERFEALAQRNQARGKHRAQGAKQAQQRAAAAAQKLAAEERETYRLAHQEALLALGSRRYLRMLDAFAAYAADPPMRKASKKAPANTALAEAVATASARLFAAEAALAETTDPGEREEALHEVRKRAKGLRYVGDLAHESGADLPAWAGPVKQLQELLGEHQDAVVLRDWLRARARAGSDEAFRLGIEQLIAGERARARKRAGAYPSAMRAVHEAWADGQAPRPTLGP